MTEVNIKEHSCRNTVNQAYHLLHIAFIIIPIVAGLDKFFNWLTSWQQYLSSPFNIFGNAGTTMMVVGIIEIIVGIGVWIKPKYFAYVVAAWLFGIIINMLILGKFYDIALREFGLMLAALALGRLAACHEHYVH